MRAGPAGSRELRTATPAPSGSCANSTQLPLGLLRRLFCHVIAGRSVTAIPLYSCINRLLMPTWVGTWVHMRARPSRAFARASDLAHARQYEDDSARERSFVVVAHRDGRRIVSGLLDSPMACRDDSAPSGDRAGVPHGGAGRTPWAPCRGAPARVLEVRT